MDLVFGSLATRNSFEYYNKTHKKEETTSSFYGMKMRTSFLAPPVHALFV